MWMLIVVMGGMFSADFRITPMSEMQCKAIVLNMGNSDRLVAYCVAPDGSRWPESNPKYAGAWKRP